MATLLKANRLWGHRKATPLKVHSLGDLLECDHHVLGELMFQLRLQIAKVAFLSNLNDFN